MLTANAMGEHRAQAAEAGADHLIAKPITPESLAQGVEVTLAQAEAARRMHEGATATCAAAG
jgi:CheY-like chemotaxis protein